MYAESKARRRWIWAILALLLLGFAWYIYDNLRAILDVPGYLAMMQNLPEGVEIAGASRDPEGLSFQLAYSQNGQSAPIAIWRYNTDTEKFSYSLEEVVMLPGGEETKTKLMRHFAEHQARYQPLPDVGE